MGESLRGITLAAIAIKLLLSVACGGLIGIERGVKGQAAGFRTHILVCVGACTVMVTGQYIITCITQDADPARLGAQVISGIGFLGAGTIISTQQNRVRGLTTAAGLWADACIGLAIGIGFYEAGIGGTLVAFITIVAFRKVDKLFYSRSPVLSAYLEFDSIEHVNSLIELVRSSQMKIESLEIEKPKSGLKKRIGVTVSVKKDNPKADISMIGVLRNAPGLEFIEEFF